MTTLARTHLRYFNRSARVKRTVGSIAVAYALFNGSQYSVSYGAYLGITHFYEQADRFWAAMGIAAIALALLIIGIFVVRRMRLAWSQPNMFLLGTMTFVVTAILVMGVLMVERLFYPEGFSTSTYLGLAQWLWQIPVGFFIGTGLSWSIVDRKIAGVFATDSREVEVE